MRLIDLPISFEEKIKIAVEQWGMSPTHALLFLAFQNKEIRGDIIEVDEEGNERDKPLTLDLLKNV